MFLGGLNYSKIQSLSLNYAANTRLRIERDRTTPQAGGVFRVTKALGLYANYSESFRQITSLRTNADRSQTPFDPLIAKGYDYGVKFDFADGRYSGQGTVFRTVNINGRQSFNATDAIGAYTYETQVGENQAKGFELRLSANLTKNFQLVGGYTQTHSFVSKNPANPAIVGRAQIRSPTHAWTVTTSYRFTEGWLKGVSTGANIAYRGQAKASRCIANRESLCLLRRNAGFEQHHHRHSAKSDHGPDRPLGLRQKHASAMLQPHERLDPRPASRRSDLVS
jgi:iron complex outermembrane receptor protein